MLRHSWVTRHSESLAIGYVTKIKFNTPSDRWWRTVLKKCNTFKPAIVSPLSQSRARNSSTSITPLLTFLTTRVPFYRLRSEPRALLLPFLYFQTTVSCGASSLLQRPLVISLLTSFPHFHSSCSTWGAMGCVKLTCWWLLPVKGTLCSRFLQIWADGTEAEVRQFGIGGAGIAWHSPPEFAQDRPRLTAILWLINVLCDGKRGSAGLRCWYGQLILASHQKVWMLKAFLLGYLVPVYRPNSLYLFAWLFKLLRPLSITNGRCSHIYRTDLWTSLPW